MIQGSSIDQEVFRGIDSVKYEGPSSDNPLAYKWYDADRVVFGQSMKSLLRFAVAYWHSFGGKGADPFGSNTKVFSWDTPSDPVDRAKAKMDAAFEFFAKLGVSFYCFHDFDLVDEAETFSESERRLQKIADYARQKQDDASVIPLWGTANLFSHPRYMNGAATNPDFRVVAYAAAQVKNAIDITLALGGQHYVFWGGREGYLSLLNTDMKREREHFGRFLDAARNYARGQGFQGKFFIEPKPSEPMKHQYDFDAATVIGFLNEFGLADDFSLNIEANHATLAGHSFPHELQVAADSGMLGSIDANRGDGQNGWDTDQFPIDVRELTEVMLIIQEAGGLKGGINFDAKTRRNSTDLEDLFIAHISGMDGFAKAALVAEQVLEHTEYQDLRSKRYQSFDGGEGKAFEDGERGLEALYQWHLSQPNPEPKSGKQERFEQILNDAMFRVFPPS